MVASRVVRVRWRRSLHCSRVVSLSPQQLQGQTVRIGCSSGFWGDTTVAGNDVEIARPTHKNVYTHIEEVKKQKQISCLQPEVLLEEEVGQL